MSEATPLSASQEDYLEAIYHLDCRAAGGVRARDIGRRLRVTGASVTGALHALAKQELVDYAPYGRVALTANGRRAALGVVRRHRGLRAFFSGVLGLDAAMAEACACRVEHVVSPEVARRFERLAAWAERCPGGGPRWTGRGFRCDAVSAAGTAGKVK